MDDASTASSAAARRRNPRGGTELRAGVRSSRIRFCVPESVDQALARPAHQWLRLRGVGDGQLPFEKQRCQAMHLGPRGGRELVGLTAREFTRGLAPLDAVLQFDERAQRRCLQIRKCRRVDAVAKHDAKVVGMFERETNVCPASVDELLHRIRWPAAACSSVVARTAKPSSAMVASSASRLGK